MTSWLSITRVTYPPRSILSRQNCIQSHLGQYLYGLFSRTCGSRQIYPIKLFLFCGFLFKVFPAILPAGLPYVSKSLQRTDLPQPWRHTIHHTDHALHETTAKCDLWRHCSNQSPKLVFMDRFFRAVCWNDSFIYRNSLVVPVPNSNSL